MKRLLLLFVVLCCPFGVRADEKPVFPPFPRLATTAAELQAIKDAPDFPARREAALREADALLAKPVELPEGYGEWIFYYACPDDGTALQPLNLLEHRCPKCGKVYKDDRTVAAYRASLHYAVEQACEKLGWAYAYSGDARYAAEVKRILLKLAHDYPTYPDRRDRWGHTGLFAPLGGRRFVQSLDEAVGIIRLAKGYDLTHDAPVWSDEERSLVERDLFGLTAQTLLTFNQGINNHQTWYNAGLMAIASVRADAALAEKVITMRGGYRDQLQRSVGADGLWYEGTMAYHNYALQAMLEIVNAGRRLGLHLENEPRLKALIAGPLHAAYPDGTFPVFNDSDPGNVRMFNRAFEWAWLTWHDPLFARALAGNDQARLKELLGPEAVVTATVPMQSETMPDAGLTVLRQGEGPNAACVFIDWGPHGGGHGHFDKLGITLWANGREWLLDPGRLDYSHKEYHTWVKETAAHNTVAIDGISQQATTGQLLYLVNGKGFSACAVQSDAAYPGALLRRYLLLADGFLVDVFDVTGKQPVQIDWFAHAQVPLVQPVGKWPAGTAATPGDANGYQHLSNGLHWNSDTDSRWEFVADPAKPDSPRLHLWLARPDTHEELFTANGIGYYVTDKAPTLIRRRHAAATRFVTVYDLSGQGNLLRDVKVLPGSELNVRIQTANGSYVAKFTERTASLRKGK